MPKKSAKKKSASSKARAKTKKAAPAKRKRAVPRRAARTRIAAQQRGSAIHSGRPEENSVQLEERNDEQTYSAGQAGDIEGLPEEPEAEFESVAELAEEGQGLEADMVSGVEDAPDPDEAPVKDHRRRRATAGSEE